MGRLIYRVNPNFTYPERVVLALAYALHAVIRVMTLGLCGSKACTQATGWATGRYLQRLKQQRGRSHT